MCIRDRDLSYINENKGWYREGEHGREVEVEAIAVQPAETEGKYKMTAIINGEPITHEISQKQYDKFLAVDDYHRMKLFSKIFNEVDMKTRPEDVYTRQVIYNDGNLAYSKVATFLLICITCIGTRNKKKLEFNARKQVLYPIIIGMWLVVSSVWLFGYPMETRLYTLRLNIWLYMLASVIGVVLVHICLLYTSRCV